MSDAAAGDDKPKLTQTTLDGARGLFAAPSTAGLMLVARPLVAAIYQRGRFTEADTAAGVLMFYAVGLSGYFIQQILPRAFYAMQDSKTPARTAVLAVGANIVLNLTLIWPLGAGGLALSTALCSYVQVGVLLWLLHRRMGIRFDAGFGRVLVKTLAATALMAAAGAAVRAAMSGLPATFWMDTARIGALWLSVSGVWRCGLN